MFKLYFYTHNAMTELVFSDVDLEPCLEYIRRSKLYPLQCLITTPNDRLVTFDNDGNMGFSEFVEI